MSKDYDIHDNLYEWMLQYQQANGVPPTLREVTDAQGTMNYRSSARHTLHSLIMRDMVVIVRPEGHSRRYQAVLPQKVAA